MSKLTIPAGYKTPLSTYEMQRAIEFIKSNFQVNLGQALNLRRVSAPLFVEESSGLNDNLNGVERPVSFDIPDVGATTKYRPERTTYAATTAAITMKNTRNCFSGSHVYSAVRDTSGNARSTTAIRNAQVISSANSRRWGLK